MKKNVLKKSALREIRSTLSRFLSIFGIVALGVGFFSGVKAASPDMRNTVDNYLDGYRLADMRVVSTYGFDDGDIAAAAAIEGAEVYPSYFADLISHCEGRSPAAARLTALNSGVMEGRINALALIDGRMPANEHECLVNSSKMKGGPSVGTVVRFTANDGTDPDDMISVYEYTIVGRVNSPMYIDKTTRGSTTVGNGSIESVYYIPEENFCAEYHTELYLRFPEIEGYVCYSSEYRDAADAFADIAEKTGEKRSKERYDEIVSEAEEKIADAEAELADAQKEYDEKIADGEKELADGEAEIAENEQKLIDAEAEIAENEQKLNDGEKEYADGLAEYSDGLIKYNDGLAEYEKGLAEFSENKSKLDAAWAEYYAGAEKLEAGKTEFEARKAEVEAGKAQAAAILGVPELTQELIDRYSAISPDMKALADGIEAIAAAEKEIAANEKLLTDSKAQLDEAQAELDAGEAELAEGKRTLDDSRIQLADAEKTLADARAELDDGWQKLNDGKTEVEDGRKELADAKVKLEDGRKELEDGRAEGAEKIADAREKLDDAKKQVEDLPEPKWYVFTRDDYPGYTEYGENADRINNIAAVFPVFFIIVAMLVCLTTMSRMVEEQRVYIGTLKALGYGNRAIIMKYMFYAVSATLLGCVTGCGVGMYLFPFVIIKAYGMMYDIVGMSLTIDVATALTASAVFTAAIAFTVWLTARSALAEQSAQLMRPKAPKNGKRIFLEHISPVWKRFSFSSKVTARNLFRYKRKMFMTVIGIAGCTALLLTGLALYDSINDIIAKQFEDIQNYQGILAYDSDSEPDAAGKAADVIAEHGGTSISVYQKLVKISANGKSVDAYISVPSEPERFTEFFDLRSRTTGEKYSLSGDSIYLDEKSTLLLGGIKPGGSAEIELSETRRVPVTVTAPFENYPNHYIYMTPETYEAITGEAPEYNVLYFRHDLGTGREQDKLGEELLNVDGVLTVSFNSNTVKTFTAMLEALGLVIVVIIASAGLLAFVVTYNLTNINITERIREIATLKVLGFYDLEVDKYIFRENIILSLIGTAFGLVLGRYLATFVITTAEVDLVMFGRNIYPASYIIAAVATVMFSVLVTFAMHKRLRNVDMIEALKSGEEPRRRGSRAALPVYLTKFHTVFCTFLSDRNFVILKLFCQKLLLLKCRGQKRQ